MIRKLLLSFLFFIITFFSFGQTVTKTFLVATTPKTFTVPPGVSTVTAECWGGGGAGGGSTTAVADVARGGAGGGGGAYAKADLAVTPGNVLTAVVGAGGIAATTTAGINGNGGNSTISGLSATIYAAGGNGGTTNSSGGSPTGGTGGTTGNAGTTIIAGNNGGNGNTGYGIASGAGGAGAGPGGGAGGATRNTAGDTNPGNNGSTFGGGGGGARTSETDGRQNGGAGAAGRVIITYNCPTSAGTLSGTQYFCTNNSASTTFSSTVPGGTWSSNNNSVATVTNTSTGTITIPQNANGSATITYTIPATTDCPTPQTSSRIIYASSSPSAVPGTITGSTIQCQSSTATYSISPIAGASSYAWSYLGTGATLIQAADGLSVNVSFSATATSGNMRVSSTNACGSNGPKDLGVVIAQSTVGGTLNSSSTPSGCQSQGYITHLELGGYVGSILQWEKSTDNFASNITVMNTTVSGMDIGGSIGQTTSYRVLVRNSTCSSVYSTITTVIIGSTSYTVSSASSSTPADVCIGTAIPTITHNTTGATGIGTPSNLPAGVTASFASNKITITGIPTASGTFNYSIPLIGGCGTATNATGTITVRQNTATASSNPILCIGSGVNISHTTTGATGINNAGINGLPAGVSASWNNNTISITGTPSVANTYNYSIPLTGGCGTVNATGTITVNANKAVSSASPNITACISTPISITHTVTGGVTGIGSSTPALPNGVTASLLGNTITISGTPTVSGSFPYSIPVNGCGSTAVNAIGTITITAVNSAAASSNTNTCIGVAMTAITQTTTGATGINSPGVTGANGLPPGVSATWSGNIITISGTPSVANTYNYSIPLTGGCGTVNATGTITVNANKAVSSASPNITACIGTPISITHTVTGGVAGIGASTSALPNGVTASLLGNTITISGTPTVSGSFPYSIPVNGCGSTAVNAIGTITITAVNSAAASSNPSVCVNTLLTTTQTTTGATGINNAGITGLPSGVSASWNNNTITITGTPTVANTYNYSIPLTGGCGTVNATGTITVNPILTPSVTISASPSGTVCQGSMITFTANVTNGGTTPTYTWYKNTTQITNQIGSTFQITDLEDGDKVKVIITSNASPCLSATTTATSNEIQPSITMTDRGRTQGGGEICLGTATPLLKLVNYYGPGNTPYSNKTKVLYWEYRDNNTGPWTKIDNTAEAIEYQPPGILTVTRAYRAQAQTPGCPMLFAAIETSVIIKPLPTVTLITQANPTECLETNVTYTTQANQFDYIWTVPGTLNQDYKIMSGGIGLGNNTVTLQWLTSGSKTVTVNYKNSFSSNNGVPNNNGCYATTPASSTTTVYPTPTAPVLSTIVQPTCTVATGSINLSGLPATGLLRYLAENSTTGTYTISGTTMTISGLSPGKYKFAIDNPCGTLYSAEADISGNKWNGTSWSNGNAEPTLDDVLVFAADYNLNKDISGCSCTVTNNANVRILTGKTMTITNFVHVDSGTLTFEDDASLVQTNPDRTINSGSITYYRNSLPIRQADFVYWSTPVNPQKLVDVSPLTLGDKFMSYSGTGWIINNKNNLMTVGKGYIIRGPQGTSNTSRSAFTAKFEGTPNTGTITTAEGYIAGKFHLLGNPYPSALDADDFIRGNDALEGTLYFWTHNTPVVLTTNYKYSTDDYASYNLSGGVRTSIGRGTGTPADSGDDASGNNLSEPLGKIAAGQGFFAGFSYAGEITYKNTMRRGGSENTQFFKPGKTSKTTAIEKNRLWLNLTNAEGAFKQMLVGYVEGATNDYDRRYDGISFDGNKYIDFYSLIGTSKFVIQGRALPFADTDTVPLAYKSTIAGDFSISIDHADGFLNTQPIYLEDKKTGKIHDLKAANYTFTTEIGTFSDRFVLRYTNKTLGTGDFENIENGLLVSVKDKAIKVTSAKEVITGVTIFDINGKQLYNKTKIGSTELQISNLQSGNQVLLLKVTLENGYIVTKKIIFN